MFDTVFKVRNRYIFLFGVQISQNAGFLMLSAKHGSMVVGTSKPLTVCCASKKRVVLKVRANVKLKLFKISDHDIYQATIVTNTSTMAKVRFLQSM